MKKQFTNNNGSEDRYLNIGLPSGSLEEATFRLLEKAGYSFTVNSRSYFPASDDSQLNAILMRAQEIAGYVERGVFDAGITGKDWVMENSANVVEITELNYSKRSMKPVRWVVAVPKESPINKLEDLRGKRIATEMVKFTKEYLNEKNIEAEVEFSWGATEVKAPVLYDAIVDATETGSSLKANNLRIVETILVSTPRLIANAESLNDLWKKEKIDRLSMLLQGAIHAVGRVGLKFNLPKKKIDNVRRVVPAMKDPTVSYLLDENWVALETIISDRKIRDLIPELKKLGARDIIEYPLNKVIP